MSGIPLSRFGFYPPHARRFGGGGKTQVMPQTVVPSAPAPTVEPPAPPAITQQPTPAPSPPATASAPEVIQAQQDLRRDALKRKGFSQTYKAGDTGGYFGNTQMKPTPQKRTLGGV